MRAPSDSRRRAPLTSANTNLTALAENLGRSLDNLANLTSNLNSQVQVNTNILGEISRAIVNADSFVQGLKRHWLLRSAFRTKDTNAPPAVPPEPLRSPKRQRTPLPVCIPQRRSTSGEAGLGSTQDQQANQPTSAQQQEADDHAIDQAEM